MIGYGGVPMKPSEFTSDGLIQSVYIDGEHCIRVDYDRKELEWSAFSCGACHECRPEEARRIGLAGWTFTEGKRMADVQCPGCDSLEFEQARVGMWSKDGKKRCHACLAWDLGIRSR